jgi:hypothetical protein
VAIETLQVLSRRQNMLWQEQGPSNTPLAVLLSADFQITRVRLTADVQTHQLLIRLGLLPTDY